MEYKSVGIPKSLFDRFRAIQPALGYRKGKAETLHFPLVALYHCLSAFLWNFSEYVVDKIRQQLRMDEIAADALLMKMAEKENEPYEH